MSKPKANPIQFKHNTFTNNETGEIIPVVEVIKPVERTGFMITYLSEIITAIERLGNQKMQVVKYILASMDVNTNTLIITTRELAEKAKVGHNTVLQTLKLLDEAEIIKRRTGAIIVSPKLVHRGSEAKERALLQRFVSFDGAAEE